MKKLNQGGFTLIEVLAVIVILGILLVIMSPVVNSLINENKERNYRNLKNNFVVATKNYVSDYRYEIKVDSGTCSESNRLWNVLSIRGVELVNSKFLINYLVSSKYLKVTDDGIKNPETNKILKADASYVTIKFDCIKKDYKVTVNDSDLVWQ